MEQVKTLTARVKELEALSGVSASTSDSDALSEFVRESVESMKSLSISELVNTEDSEAQDPPKVTFWALCALHNHFLTQ